MSSTSFHDAYLESLNKLNRIDFTRCAAVLGLELDGQALIIPFFEQVYRVNRYHITLINGENTTIAVELVLCRYLLNCPPEPLPPGESVTFRELKKAGPLVSSFATNTNKLITGAFADDPEALERAAGLLFGKKQTIKAGYDIIISFDALPRITLTLQFNCADSRFPAQCSILFNGSAEVYLDMQSLFILGTYMAGGLVRHGRRV